MTSKKEESLDELKDPEEEKVYKDLNGLGTGATHRGNQNMSFNMSMGASMDFGDSFAVADDDDDLIELSADAAQFQKLESDKTKNKQAVRTASRQPGLEVIGEDGEEDDEEEDA